jgi:hypothetical protein
VASNSEKCVELLGVFVDALDARDYWVIRSKLFLGAKVIYVLVSITFSFSCEVFDAWAKNFSPAT